MNKLEVLIAKRESRDRVYVSFPTTRKEIRETLGSIGIVKDDWLIVGVKTGSNPFVEFFRLLDVAVFRGRIPLFFPSLRCI